MYKKRLTAFIDILGFSELVKEINVEESQGLQKFYEVQKLSTELKSRERPSEVSGEVEVTAFSDSIVISVENDRKALFSIFWYVAWLQSSLMKSGYLSRGGIAFGELHHKEGVVFGKGLLDAYKIESNLAIYPRIVVSDEIIDMCRGGLRDVFLTSTDDGLFHINLFSIGDFIGTDEDAADGNDLTELFYENLEAKCQEEIARLKEAQRISPLMKWQWAYKQTILAKQDYLIDRKCKMDRFLYERKS